MRIPSNLLGANLPPRLKEDLGIVQIFNAKNGQKSLRYLQRNQSYRHIHSGIAPDVFHYEFEAQAETLLVLGVGLAWELTEILSKYRSLILVDPHPELIPKYLDPRILVLGPETPVEKWYQAREILSQCKSLQVKKHSVYQKLCPQWFQGVLNWLWPQSMVNQEFMNLKTLALLRGPHFILREISEALDDYGSQMEHWDWSQDQNRVAREMDFQAWLIRTRPSSVLSVNGKGLDREGFAIETLKRYGIPLILWFVDDPSPILRAYPQILEHIHLVLCWEKTYIPQLKGAGARRVEYLPLATEKKRFKAEIQPQGKDVIFVGNPMTGAFWRELVRKANLSDSEVLEVQNLSQELVDGSLEFNSIAKRLEHLARSPDHGMWLHSAVLHGATALKRMIALNSLENSSLKIFGDVGEWSKRVPGANCCAAVSYPEGFDQVSLEGALQINLTSAQMPTALNQRVFDLPALGKRFLTDRQADFLLHFPGCEALTFGNLDELKSKTVQALLDPQWGLAELEKMRQVILQKHLYHHRLEQISQWMN